MAFRLEDDENEEGGSNLQNSSDSDSDVIFMQEDTKSTQAPSTGQDYFTMRSLEGRMLAVQIHSTPFANAHTTPTTPLHILPLTQTTERATPTCTPESTAGSTHCMATWQNNLSEIQGSQPNLARNKSSSE